jgi:hypothetical protein
MPLELTTAIPRDPIASVEVIGFHIDLQSMQMQVRLAELTQAGEMIGQQMHGVNLVSNGQPRFTSSEYNSIKAAIYRLLIADGIVAGSVV